MVLRVLRMLTGLALVAAGVLLWVASSQRWSGFCPWGGDPGTRACDLRQDHRYDFLLPADPWIPVGSSAELGGAALLVVAAALLPATWALRGRRPGLLLTAMAAACVLAYASIGLATLRSGLTGQVVEPGSPGLAFAGWLLAPTVLLGTLVVLARGWARAAAVLLILGSPMVAMVSYAIGSFDAAPWWEATMGVLLGGAGTCLVVAAVLRSTPSTDPAPARALAATA
jgi:hypothetical protein